jgi:two-component system cell cycle response regulator CtrA
MRVLVIGSISDEHSDWVLKAGFQRTAIDVDEVADEDDAIYALEDRAYDAVLLLQNIWPNVNPYSVLLAIRRKNITTPLIAILAESDVNSKVKWLNAGADDVLCTPFHGDELVARLQALFRRSQNRPTALWAIGPVSIDTQSNIVWFNGAVIHLPKHEYLIFERLASRPGMTMTKPVLMNLLYDGLDDPDPKIIDVFICKIRKKLRTAGAPPLIETVWGQGYRLTIPETTAAKAA